jgi:hypothetical protein
MVSAEATLVVMIMVIVRMGHILGLIPSVDVREPVFAHVALVIIAGVAVAGRDPVRAVEGL